MRHMYTHCQMNVHTHLHKQAGTQRILDRCCWGFFSFSFSEVIYFKITVHYFCWSGFSFTQLPTGRQDWCIQAAWSQEAISLLFITTALISFGRKKIPKTVMTLLCVVLYEKQCRREICVPREKAKIYERSFFFFFHSFARLVFYELLLILQQTSRPEAFPHPHRLPTEGSRIGTNRPCSQVSTSSPLQDAVAVNPYTEQSHLFPWYF